MKRVTKKRVTKKCVTNKRRSKRFDSEHSQPVERLCPTLADGVRRRCNAGR
jgi:hypothetical protein